VKIGSGGSLPKEVCSRSSHSLAHWLALDIVAFLGRGCGGLRVLREWGYLFISFCVVGDPRQDPYFG
jgi:hypothetical protein